MRDERWTGAVVKGPAAPALQIGKNTQPADATHTPTATVFHPPPPDENWNSGILKSEKDLQ